MSSAPNGKERVVRISDDDSTSSSDSESDSASEQGVTTRRMLPARPLHQANLSIVACFSRGFGMMRRNFCTYLVRALIVSVLSSLIGLLGRALIVQPLVRSLYPDPVVNSWDTLFRSLDERATSHRELTAAVIDPIVIWILTVPFRCGLIVAAGASARRGTASLSDFFVPLSSKLAFVLIVEVLFYLAAAIGILLLILPGIYASVVFSMAAWVYVIYGSNLDDVQESFAVSRERCQRNFFGLIGLYFAWLCIFFIPFLLFGFGLTGENPFLVLLGLVSFILLIPWVEFSFAIAFDQLFGFPATVQTATNTKTRQHRRGKSPAARH